MQSIASVSVVLTFKKWYASNTKMGGTGADTVKVDSIIAQKDSKTSVQIAASTKRDSSSAIAIALMGAVFLPGTYIAVSNAGSLVRGNSLTYLLR